MKCESCQGLLEEYLDGELTERESREVAGHLAACAKCAGETAMLAAEQELFSRYDREVEISAAMWEEISERTLATGVPIVSRNGFGARFAALFGGPSVGFSLAAAAILLAITAVIFTTYLKDQKPKEEKVVVTPPPQSPVNDGQNPPAFSTSGSPKRVERVAVNNSSHRKPSPIRRPKFESSDVVSTDFGYQDIDDQETARHLEQTQNLLRSIRNVKLNDSDVEIDVSYDKALSRRLLNENIVLRRDAEMKAKYPTKALLSDLEPFLIDIANLPDQAKAEEVRVIKERVRKTEIVAALIGY